jgi:hypothetical protein
MTHKQMLRVLLDKNYKTDWGQQHEAAIARGAPVWKMIEALAAYADDYSKRYDGSELHSDYLLGPVWEKMCRGTLELLNGKLAGLDGGTCDAILRDMLAAEGFKEE